MAILKLQLGLGSIVLLTLLMGTAQSESASQTDVSAKVELIRIAVLDISSSMRGKRRQESIDELREMGRQLPPSPSHPFVLIPFDSQVRNVKKFVDRESYDKFLSQLQTGGGTRIASGLARAVIEMKPFVDSNHVIVLLYTDGEDSNQQAILREEAKLDQLFAQRSKRGLHQTVVFCKRWEGANAALVAAVRKHGHADVVDAGELRLVPVTLQPQLTVTGTTWDTSRPLMLKINLSAEIHVRGTVERKLLAPIQISCVTANVEGKARWNVAPNQPASISLSVPVAKPALSEGEIEIEFDVSAPATLRHAEAMFLPTLVADRIRLPVKLPPQSIRSLIATRFKQRSASRWIDPLRSVASFPVTLEIEVTSVPSIPWSQPVEFQITPAGSTQITKGKQSFVLSKPERIVVDLTVQRPMTPAAGAEIELTIEPVALPSNAILVPPKVEIKERITAPAATETIIVARPTSITRAHWVDLAQATAAFEANVEFRVKGSLAPTDLIVSCPSTVRHVEIVPPRLKPGVQNVKLRLWATLPAAPRQETLVFQVLPPQSQGAVRISAPKPFRFSVPGPKPKQLVLSRPGKTDGRLEIVLGHRQSLGQLELIPFVHDLSDRRTVGGLTAAVRAGQSLQLAGQPKTRLFAPANFQVRPTQTASRSFFRDTLVPGELTVAPVPASAAVIGARQQIVVRYEAPFKRFAFWIAVVVAALIALYVVVRLYGRFTTVSGI